MPGIFLLANLLFGGCLPAPEPVRPEETKIPSVKAPGPGVTGTETWETTLSQAKREGVVSVYANWKPEIRIGVSEVFREKFGINVEFLPFGRGEEIAARAQQEKAAGLTVVDIFGGGASTLLTVLKPLGLLGAIEPLLILPDTIDPKFWRNERFPFIDKDKQAVGMMMLLNRDIMYNTDLIKQGEITTFRDVLRPQYKGKISLDDPSLTGAGAAMMSLLAVHIWNLEEAKEFLRQLIKQQAAELQRNNRLHFEGVARGKFAIGLGNNNAALAEFVDSGAPINVVYTREGVSSNTSSGAIAVPTKFAHPNAAKIFVNWLLSKEGQIVFAKAFGAASMRSDVAIEGIHPIFLMQPGEKLFLQTEEEIVARPKLRTIFKEIVEAK